jgi:ubiquinone/menaquinone biosynthesis C-methylase UbiE
MTTAIDGLTSPTLKHLREHWWDEEFTEFLAETLRPRPGNTILDVGCGEGLAEVSIGRLHISQIRLVGVDLAVSKVIAAARETASHNQRVRFAAADACHLPFATGAFDSLFCVAVLQHVADVNLALAECARVTARSGRVVAVEPDNSARYGFSSVPSGRAAFEASERLFSALAAARHERTDPAIGPKLPELFARHGIDPISVRLFPVYQTRLGAPSSTVWAERREAVERLVGQTGDEVRACGREYVEVLAAYEREATEAGPAFVEIQNTMLFATVGQRQ